MNSQGFNIGSVLARCACFLIFVSAIAAFGQAGRGSISGTITDPNGALIQGAQITLLNPATGVTQHAVTNGAGFFSFISLNPGEYKVTATQTGFAGVAREKVVVNVD